MSKPVQIKTLEELRGLASKEEPVDCFIQLNFGARSSKSIHCYGSGWSVYNEIDDTEQTCITDKELGNDTLIIEAIEKGALYRWEVSDDCS